MGASSHHRIFRAAWWTCNALLALTIVALAYSAVWEYSVRQYLNGFSDAVLPADATPEKKVEAILDWMSDGPARIKGDDPELDGLDRRDPETTLNYQQLLAVCGTATNAFLNLARSADLPARRLLLLDPSRSTKHVVAEVLLDDKWVIVDPTYRVIMRDAQGRLLTRKDLQDPEIFKQATAKIANYPAEYNYGKVAHVRVAAIPLEGLRLRKLLDRISPTWDESVDWSLLVERESFLMLTLSVFGFFLFLFVRAGLAWYADRRILAPRFHLRQKFARACTVFFSTPEMK